MENLTLFLQKAGITGYPLVAIATVVLAVIMERAWFFIRTARTFKGFSSETYREIVQKKQVMPNGSSFPATVLFRTFTAYSFVAYEDTKQAFDEEWKVSNRFMKILEYAVGIAPLLGILGTITGIIKSFTALGDFTGEQRAVITGGIAEALLTTAAGLIIAIAALTAHYIFKWIQKGCFSEIEKTLSLLESAVKDEEKR